MPSSWGEQSAGREEQESTTGEISSSPSYCTWPPSNFLAGRLLLYGIVYARPDNTLSTRAVIDICFVLGLFLGPVIAGAFADSYTATWRWVSSGLARSAKTQDGSAEVHPS